MTSPVHSGRIVTPVPVNAETTTPTGNTGSTSQRHLEGPTELGGRPPSGHLSAGHSQRIRQPVPEIRGGSPQHDGSRLLNTGERSDRFGSFEHSRHSGSMSHVGSHVTIHDLGFDSESTAASEPASPPPEAAVEGLERPEPRRSWMAVGAALVGGLKQAAGVLLNEASVTLGIARLPNIPKHLAGALAGHSIHQSIAVGIPTFIREMVGVAVMHAMRSAPPSTAVGVQVSVGAANLLIQGMREYLELRRPDEAARAYASLTAEEWAAKSPDEQDALRLHHRRASRAITMIQFSASATNVALMIHNFAALDPVNNPGFAGHDHTAALRPLGNEVKVGVYAALRDGIQASFSMVGFKPSPTATPGHEFAAGMRGPAHAAAAATYAAANAGSSFLSDALMGAWVPDRGDAISTLMGNTATKMSHAEAWLEVAKGAGVSAMANTLAETIDWFQRTQHFVNETGASQHWEPKLTGTDYGRVLDQAPARAAAFNGIFSALTLAGGEMAKSDLPPAVQQFIGNAGLGVMIAMLDSPVSGIWQAEDAVRQATRSPGNVRIEEIQDAEMANVVPSSGEVSGGAGSNGSGATHLSAGNPPERHRSPSPDPA